MKKINKAKLENLYKCGMSMQDISDKEGVPYPTIRYLMSKYKIPRRSWSDATYVKRNPNGDPFKIKQKLDKEDIGLKNLGLGIYWGEGDKSPNNTSVRMGNTDPFLLRKFREFLRNIYQVEETKFSYGLILFNDIKEIKAVKFWKERLGIRRKQLGKITIIPPQGKGTYKKKSEHGVLTISFTNKKLKEIILNEIKKLH